MKTKQFSILINADKQTVWDTMLEDKTYRIWAKEFHEGSYYEGSWEKGSEIRFLGPDDEGKLGGMYAHIKENRKYEYISIEHQGLIVNGEVDTTSDEVKKWAPALENYTFIEKGPQTELIIEMQLDPEFETMFDEMYPRALKVLKALCEQ
jgi:hypothetical protein